MKALSLTRPWGWIIVHLGKRIENRQWAHGTKPPIVRHRGPLLLHNAKSWSDDAVAWVAGVFGYGLASSIRAAIESGTDELLQPGAIIARCTAVGDISPARASIIGAERVVTLDSVAEDRRQSFLGGLDLRWHMVEQFGLILDDVVRLDRPVKCGGALGLWTPPAHALAAIGGP